MKMRVRVRVKVRLRMVGAGERAGAGAGDAERAHMHAVESQQRRCVGVRPFGTVQDAQEEPRVGGTEGDKHAAKDGR